MYKSAALHNVGLASLSRRNLLFSSSDKHQAKPGHGLLSDSLMGFKYGCYLSALWDHTSKPEPAQGDVIAVGHCSTR